MVESPYRQTELQQAPPASERATLRRQVERIRGEYLRVLETVEQVILGKRQVIARVLTALAARGHVLLVDLPGTGKTQMCKAICAAIDARFGRVQCTPDLLPADVTGGNVLDPRTRELSFRPGPVFTQLLLVDEINRATPKTQAALLEVMEERAVTVEGRTHALEEPFQVLATMNPVDHHGTFPLPAAQVDRFLFALQMGYPSPEDEVRVLERHLGGSALASITPVLGQERLLDWCRTAAAIHVAPAVKRAAVDYVNALRYEGGGLQPISPRATLAWVRAAQARAMLEGRDFASTDDLLEVAPDVLRHRLSIDPETVRERLRAVTVGSAANGGAA